MSLKSRKSYNTSRIDNVRKKQSTDAINEAKMIMNNNFTESNKDMSNNAIAILDNTIIFGILGAPIIFSWHVFANDIWLVFATKESRFIITV